MGQPNAKEMRRKPRNSAQGNAAATGNATRMDSTNAVHQTIYSNTILQATQQNSNENLNDEYTEQNNNNYEHTNNSSNSNRERDSNNHGSSNGEGDLSPVHGSPNQRVSRTPVTNAAQGSNTATSDRNYNNNNNNSNNGNNKGNNSARPYAASSEQVISGHGNLHTDPLHMTNVSSHALINEGNVPQSPTKTYPIVFRYTDKDVQTLLEKKKNVGVMVEALNWWICPMSASTDSFYALLELPPGHHNYRFVIDGHEVIDRTQPLAPMRHATKVTTETSPKERTSQSNSQRTPQESGLSGVPLEAPLPQPTPPKDGKPANMVYLNEVLLTTREDDDIMDDGSGWGQEPIMFEESRKYPPVMPVHLRYTPLNTPPTLFRSSNHHNNNNTSIDINNINNNNNNNNNNTVLNIDQAYHLLNQPSHDHLANAGYIPDDDEDNNGNYNANNALAPHHTEFNSYTDFLHSQPIDSAGELPIPLSVTINHVYFQRRDDHAVIGVTTRYCNKFTTVVYYSHLPQSVKSIAVQE